MLQMFEGCKKLTTLDLSSFVTDNVEYMSGMFYNCTKLSTVYVGDGWSTEHLTSSGGGGMFLRCNNLVGGAGTVYDANHVDAEYARVDGGTESPGYFTQKPREAYAVLSTDSTSVTFYYDDLKASRVSEGVIVELSVYDAENKPEWATGNLVSATFDESFAVYEGLTSLSCWFYDCGNLASVDGLPNLCSDSVTDMSDMFNGCSSLTSLDLSNLNTYNTTIMDYMFEYCSALTSLDISGFNTEKVEGMQGMFMGCSSLIDLDISHFNTENVRVMGEMFSYCSSLTNLDLSNFNTENVHYMAGMFNGCTSLIDLDISHFNTENVTVMSNMFRYCSSLTNLDLSSFNTEKVEGMRDMFKCCFALTTVYVGNHWNTSFVTSSDFMFDSCTYLRGGNGTLYNESNPQDKTYARIDDPDNGQPGYFTAKYVGDVNGDSSVNVSDVTSLVSIILGNSEPNSAADVNKDGEVNVSDVTAIVSIILGND